VIVDVFADPETLAAALATRVISAIAHQPGLVLGLPTGRTPQPLYAALRRLTAQERVDWSRVRTFNLDEFIGVPASSPASYRGYMQLELFGSVGIGERQIGFLDGTAPDLEQECRRYEAAIAAAGGIDLMILGVGANGHIGFNEPGAQLHARTHVAELQPGTRASNAALFGGHASRVPLRALSMGMATILQSRTVVLMATGAAKAAATASLLQGPITTTVPASFLQLHPAVRVMLDRAAASPR
jgi:glucosamine-6-phosphate deaminase